MGWWKADSGDVLGDQPADVVSADLEALSEYLLARRGRRLALDELLGNVDLVLRTKTADLLAPGETYDGRGLTAELELIDEERRVTVEMATPDDPEVRDRIDAMCAQMSLYYSAGLERRPTCSELLGSISFVLGYKPDRVLAVPPRARVAAIRRCARDDDR